jgi:hypothetical protein
MRCVKKGANIYINAYPFTYSGDMGRHNHPLLGLSVLASDPYRITTFLASQRVHASDPHGLCTLHYIRLGNGSDIICNDPPQRHNIIRFLALLIQTFQDVTHSSTTLAKAYLTAEF